MRCAALLNARMHCNTCVGSLFSYKSTVRNISCEGRSKGDLLQASMNIEMFSIWTKGITALGLNLGAEPGFARFMSLEELNIRNRFTREYGKSYILAQRDSIFQIRYEVSPWKRLSEGLFDESPYFIYCSWGVLIHAQFAHIAIEGSNGSHNREYCCVTL